MGRGINRLTPLGCTKSKKPMLCDGGGLWLRTKPALGGGYSRSWLFRYAIAGKKGQMGLGSLHDRPLAEARAKRDELRKLLLEGIDPKADRDRKRAEALVAALPIMTFKQAAQAHIDSHEKGWSPKQTGNWNSMFQKYVYPVIGPLPVAAIGVDLVLKCLEPHWVTIPNTMMRVRGRIEAVLDACAARGLRDSTNPARWSVLKHLLAKPSKLRPVEHHEAMSFEELPAFLNELRKLDGPAPRALEFVILTAARAGEARLATWGEIDFATATWTVPPSRMKAGREHRVPLCKRAVAILEEMRDLDPEMIFPRHGGPAGLRRVLKRLGRDVSVHGFRSSFRDWCGARSNFPREVAEMALAHKVGNAVELAYARSDLFEKRRRLMAAWFDFCTSAPKKGELVHLRA